MSHESYITIKRDGQTTKYSKSKSLLKLPIGFLYNRYSYLLRQGKYLYTFYIQLKKVARGENPSYMLYFYTMIVNSSIIIFSGYASLTGQQKIKHANTYVAPTDCLLMIRLGRVLFLWSKHIVTVKFIKQPQLDWVNSHQNGFSVSNQNNKTGILKTSPLASYRPWCQRNEQFNCYCSQMKVK